MENSYGLNKGINEPETADVDFRRERGAVSDSELARIESLDTSWNPDKSPEGMAKYEASLLAAGGEYAKLARTRAQIAELMKSGVDFETARKTVR
jgi:hypothetical protein